MRIAPGYSSILAALASATSIGIAIAASPARAQEARDARTSVHALLGAYVPTGEQRRDVEPSPFVGVQLGVRLRPRVALVGNVGVAQAERRRLPAGSRGVVLPDVDDAGLEVAGAEPRRERLHLVPFAGAGLGGRTYRYDRLAETSRTVAAGYAGAGGEVHLGRAGVRLEARDYLSRSASPSGAAAGAVRNDVVLAVGLSYHFRPR